MAIRRLLRGGRPGVNEQTREAPAASRRRCTARPPSCNIAGNQTPTDMSATILERRCSLNVQRSRGALQKIRPGSLPETKQPNASRRPNVLLHRSSATQASFVRSLQGRPEEGRARARGLGIRKRLVPGSGTPDLHRSRRGGCTRSDCTTLSTPLPQSALSSHPSLQ